MAEEPGFQLRYKKRESYVKDAVIVFPDDHVIRPDSMTESRLQFFARTYPRHIVFIEGKV